MLPYFSGVSISVTTKSLSSGGVDEETSESIRFNAPLTFTSQNRAVTADDYAAIIKKSFSFSPMHPAVGL